MVHLNPSIITIRLAIRVLHVPRLDPIKYTILTSPIYTHLTQLPLKTPRPPCLHKCSPLSFNRKPVFEINPHTLISPRIQLIIKNITQSPKPFPNFKSTKPTLEKKIKNKKIKLPHQPLILSKLQGCLFIFH